MKHTVTSLRNKFSELTCQISVKIAKLPVKFNSNWSRPTSLILEKKPAGHNVRQFVVFIRQSSESAGH